MSETKQSDDVFRTRSLGAAAEGIKDQYADGKAARVWGLCIGDKKERTKKYKDFLVGMLRKKGCKRILDVACGTGVDSIMLLEEGFDVVSVDASDKMLKYALKARWDRRKEIAFDNWSNFIIIIISLLSILLNDDNNNNCYQFYFFSFKIITELTSSYLEFINSISQSHLVTSYL